MQATPPFWFAQRQCKIEPVTESVIKVTGPNLAEAFLRVEKESQSWKAGLRKSADGPDIAATEADIPNPRLAWDAAFELYRQHVIA